jgi:hypothetical protein
MKALFSYDNLAAIKDKEVLYFISPGLLLLSSSTLQSECPTADLNVADDSSGLTTLSA